ncbi:hypothetical protein [uncultured Clostridium sp.]|nr:hypothetical protein [uncultured Clostridium sp.]
MFLSAINAFNFKSKTPGSDSLERDGSHLFVNFLTKSRSSG